MLTVYLHMQFNCICLDSGLLVYQKGWKYMYMHEQSMNHISYKVYIAACIQKVQEVVSHLLSNNNNPSFKNSLKFSLLSGENTSYRLALVKSFQICRQKKKKGIVSLCVAKYQNHIHVPNLIGQSFRRPQTCCNHFFKPGEDSKCSYLHAWTAKTNCGFNHRVVTLIADWLQRDGGYDWLIFGIGD